MIRFRLTELIADTQFKTGRRITLLEIAETTGVNRMTLSRMANVRGYSTSTETIDKLCRYFGCEVGDVAQYIDEQPPSTAIDGKAKDGEKASAPVMKRAASQKRPGKGKG